MSEKIIRISVKDRYALAEGNPVIICGNSGYSVEFTFDPEWDGYEVKTARFVYVKRGEVKYQDVVFAGTTAVVPILSNIQAVHVGVFAADLSTTTPARIPCRFSVRCGTGAPEDPTPSQYDQIMALLRLSDPENLVRLNQGAEHAGQVLMVGEDGRVVPADPPASNTETDTTLTESGKAADAKAVGDRITEQGKTIPKVFDWANAELPFTEKEISGLSSGGGFGTNYTNFADGKTYFRYHAGPNNFAWTNPNPQKGAVTITALAWSQYADKTAANTFSALNIVYADGTFGRLRLVNGQTVTMTTDANKVLTQIKGNYDHENWVLLDMDALSIAADYPAPTGTVKSVNGKLPDENGNVEIEIPEGGGDSGGSGGENPWVEFCTGEITEDVNELEFTGVDDFTDFLLIGDFAGGNTSGFTLHMNGKQVSVTMGAYFVHNHRKFNVTRLEIDKIRGFYRVSSSSQSYGLFTNQDISADYRIGQTLSNGENITKFSFRLGTDKYVKAGSRYTLYAR